ncbi:hypothetical protein JMJ35_003075 [Cladonia borealis]|uniref:Myb-like domain-containing protein n=1 Tax=Cladonia borealis TaxID=184061 RepID=A0AA39R409_9LECA|nr:hypothetical protein JMJ35_003075 [Cladonia borealis]
MSRHSNRYSSYGGDYDAGYDDPRNQRLDPSSRYLPDPEIHGNKYKADRSDQRDPRYDPRDHHIQSLSRDLRDPRGTPRYKIDADYDDPRDHHSNQHSKHIEDYDRWNIGSRDLNKWVPTDQWNHFSKNSGATYPHEGLARSELRRGLATGSEPFGRRPIEPAYHEPARTRQRRTIVPTARAAKYWMPDEEKKLLNLVKDGHDYVYMAEQLDRTVTSCQIHWTNKLRHKPEAEGVRYNPWRTY